MGDEIWREDVHNTTKWTDDGNIRDYEAIYRYENDFTFLEEAVYDADSREFHFRTESFLKNMTALSSEFLSSVMITGLLAAEERDVGKRNLAAEERDVGKRNLAAEER